MKNLFCTQTIILSFVLIFMICSAAIVYAAGEQLPNQDFVDKLKKKYGSEVEPVPVEEEKAPSVQKVPDSKNAIMSGPEKDYMDAMNYYDGKEGFEKNIDKAKELLLRSAEAGYIQAQNFMGFSLLEGKDGFAKDEAKGVAWFKRALEAGDTEAMVNLFYCQNLGLGGLKKSKKKAREWHDRILENDQTGSAIYRLAYFYHRVDGIYPIKDEEKRALYLKAAQKGDAQMQYNLGALNDIYYFSWGLFEVDRSEAIRWYKKAARQGHEEAMKTLKKNYGITVYEGDGPGAVLETIDCPRASYALKGIKDGLPSGAVYYDDNSINVDFDADVRIEGKAHCVYEGNNVIDLSWRIYYDPSGKTAQDDCSARMSFEEDEPYVQVWDYKEFKTIEIGSSKNYASILLRPSKKEMRKANRQKWIDLGKQFLFKLEERDNTCADWQPNDKPKRTNESIQSGNDNDKNTRTKEKFNKPKHRGPRAIMD